MNPIASFLIALAQMLWPQPGSIDFDDLPPHVQKAIEKECENYGIFDEIIFERHAEMLYRDAQEEFDKSPTETIKVSPTSNLTRRRGTHLSNAFGIGEHEETITRPPSKWTSCGEDYIDPILFGGRGEQWRGSVEIFQKLPDGQALVRFYKRSEHLYHFFGLSDLLVDNSVIEDPGFLIETEPYEYISTSGGPRAVRSFHYIPEPMIEVSPQQIIDAILTGKVSAYRFTFKRSRPNREQRDAGIEDVYEWRRTEVLPAVLAKLKRDAEADED